MKITVFGATGRTGVPLVEQALERGHEIVAFAREGTDIPAALREHESLVVVEGNAYTGESVTDAVTGGTTNAGGDPVDAVVSVLGQTSAGSDDLLTVAGEHILDAMKTVGVERFVILVGAGVREDGESVSLGGKVMESVLKLVASDILADAETHANMVRASDIRWTIVRGPRLTEAEHTGRYRAGTDLKLGMRQTAARANVAQFILECLEDDHYIGKMPKIADR